MSETPPQAEKLWKGLAAGALAGLAASYVMNQFQSLWTKAAQELSSESGDRQPSSGEDSTVKIAQAISQEVFSHALTEDEKAWAGPAVHYAFGTLMGAVYGALAETVPAARAGYGTAYGAAVWLTADEIAVPALGLSEPPSKTPASSHAKALASHLVYGLTADLVRRLLLPPRP